MTFVEDPVEAPPPSVPQITLTARQQEAVDMIVSQPISVLSGLPGSGKSCAIGNVVSTLQSRRESFLLAAPTGKAARRVAETTKCGASTVHRLLEYHPAEGFRIGAANPFSARQVIVDEASMLDTELAAALLSAVRVGQTRLCLTGDAYQLPSVGPGRILGDLIESGIVPSVELTEVHRAAAESWVCRSAPVIKAGGLPDLRDVKDFAFWQESTLEGVENAVLEAVSGILQGHGVRPCVITPRRQGVAASAETLNPKLQQLLNPEGAPTGFRSGDMVVIRTGDLLIQRSNDYELGVFNGELGAVQQVQHHGKDEKVLLVEFEGAGLVALSRQATFKTRLAYALTGHSTQGSQFPWIVVICHSGHGRMLYRQLLYTMVTRAMKGLILIGDLRGIQKSLATDAPLSRKTGLVERLRGLF